MLPALLGLIVAMAFRMLAVAVYGESGLITHAWIDLMFWYLVSIGALSSLVNMLPLRRRASQQA